MNVLCSVCTINMHEADDLRVTKCGHLFHTGCVAPAVARQSVCPECRVNCPPKSLIRLCLNVNEEQNARETRVHRLVAQLEKELQVKLSVSSLAAGGEVVALASAAAPKAVAAAPDAAKVTKPPSIGGDDGGDANKRPSAAKVAKVAAGELTQKPAIGQPKIPASADCATSGPTAESRQSASQATASAVPVQCSQQVSTSDHSSAAAAPEAAPSPWATAVGAYSYACQPLSIPQYAATAASSGFQAHSSAVAECAHSRMKALWCLDHRLCNTDCMHVIYSDLLSNSRRRIVHVEWQRDSVYKYCTDCSPLKCFNCKLGLGEYAQDVVRYKNAYYHEMCFPCQRCGIILCEAAINMLRPSQRIHDECLRCSRCDRSLIGELYDFRNDSPICQDCI